MSTRATVTRSIKRARKFTKTSREMPTLKKRAHRRERYAWRRWVHIGDDGREPTPKPLTSWDIL